MEKVTLKDGTRITTIGTWWEEGTKLVVVLAQLSDWRYMLAVLFHELSEYFWCEAHGIKTKECDEFDAWFEEQYRLGKIPKSKEAGDDKRAPYYRGHQIGSKYEYYTIRILGASWKKYVKECNLLMGVDD
jgi:hypothetical protein